MPRTENLAGDPGASVAGGAPDPFPAIVAAAASPGERAALPCFRPSGGDDAAVARREAEWIRAVSNGDAAAFHELLAFRGLSRDAFRAGLRDVRVVPGEALPGWAEELRELLSAGDRPPPRPFALGEIADAETLAAAGMRPEDPWPLHSVFAPLLAAAEARLEHLLVGSGVPVEPAAARLMLVQITQRWSVLAAEVLMHRHGPAEVLEGLDAEAGSTLRSSVFRAREPRDAWIELFRLYPVLGRVMAVAFERWSDALRELLSRLRADRSLLERTFAPAGLGALSVFTADAGDLHEGGRSVAILRFASGCTLVYKPKDLRIAAAFVELVELLNDAGLDPPLHARRVLAREGYAWDEFVPDAPCADDAEVRRFYRRAGMLARLLQLLDATDFTADNVVVHGEWPVLIDLETLASPRMRDRRERTAAERWAAEEVADSPFRSGLVTVRVRGEPGRPPADLGALAPLDRRTAPFRQSVARRARDGSLSLAREYLAFQCRTAIPELHGRRVDPADYHAEVAAGYLAMGEHLRSHRERLDRWLERLATAPVRFLCRDTHIYGRILQESLRPARLRDGVSREICLERLWKARFPSPAVVSAEVESLRDLDVPLFRAFPGADAILVGQGEEVADFFDDSALARIRARLAALRARPPEAEAALIGAALFTLAPDAPKPVSAAPSRLAPVDWDGAGEGRWLKAAAAVGEEILQVASCDASGELAWAGLYFHPGVGWSFGVLGEDLFAGTAGLAVVFAELARWTGEARFRDAAESLLRRLRLRLVEASHAKGPLPPPGGLFGWGGWLYALARGHRLLNGPQDLGSLRPLARQLAGAPAGPDVAPVERATHLLALQAAGLLAEEGAGTGVFLPPPPAERDPEAGGALIPSVEAAWSLAWARLRASGRLPENAPPPGPRADAPLGAADALCALDAARCRPEGGMESLRRAQAWLARVPRSGPSVSLLDAAEVAVSAFRVSGDERDLATAWELGTSLVARRRVHGAWFPFSWAPDRYRLATVGGVGGVASLLLRLHRPEVVPALRALE